MRKRRNATTNMHAVINITIPLKSINNIPKIEIVTIPIALYNLSTRITGAVIFFGISKLFFNN